MSETRIWYPALSGFESVSPGSRIWGLVTPVLWVGLSFFPYDVITVCLEKLISIWFEEHQLLLSILYTYRGCRGVNPHQGWLPPWTLGEDVTSEESQNWKHLLWHFRCTRLWALWAVCLVLVNSTLRLVKVLICDPCHACCDHSSAPLAVTASHSSQVRILTLTTILTLHEHTGYQVVEAEEITHDLLCSLYYKVGKLW